MPYNIPVFAFRRMLPTLYKIRNFAAGTNLRDWQGNLNATETDNSFNCTLDERGVVGSRLGRAKWNGTAYVASLPQNGFYSETLQVEIIQCGATLFKDHVNTTVRKTFSTSARVCFADFNGKAYAIHPVDGLFGSSDGVTWTVVSGAPPGTVLQPWQNRLTSLGDPSNPTRLSASAIGDATDWATGAGHGWFNDIRENTDAALVAMRVADGVDIKGNPGLVVCKNRSTYRVNDPATGAYQTLDAHIGTASALSLVATAGRMISLCEQGIFWTDGINSMKPASTQEEPLWTDAKLAFDKLSLWCAGVKGDRVYFSVPENGQTANTLGIEYHPGEGWIMFGSNAVSFYVSYGKNAGKLLGGSPTVNGQVYELLKGGTDDGTAIHAWFETAWFQPSGGLKMRVRKARPLGRGNFTLFFKADYATEQGAGSAVSIKTGLLKWGGGEKWGDGSVWGAGSYFGFGDPINSLGVCRAFAFRAEATTTTSVTAPPLLDGAYSPEVGAWALEGIDVTIEQLGLS